MYKFFTFHADSVYFVFLSAVCREMWQTSRGQWQPSPSHSLQGIHFMSVLPGLMGNFPYSLVKFQLPGDPLWPFPWYSLRGWMGIKNKIFIYLYDTVRGAHYILPYLRDYIFSPVFRGRYWTGSKHRCRPDLSRSDMARTLGQASLSPFFFFGGGEGEGSSPVWDIEFSPLICDTD